MDAKEIISKELLSAVLGVGIRSYEVSPTKKCVYYVADNVSISSGTTINIHELAHKCKEWAWKTHNKIVSSEVSVDDWVSIVAYFYGNLTVNIEESFSAETEPEAIFKACQYILDIKETK